MKNIQILLATYNGCQFVEEQLESIYRQKLPDEATMSLLVSDDNSTDNTLSLIEPFFQKGLNGTCIVKLNKKNNFESLTGACGNFSFALSQCSSEYIMFCDQDDYWLENKISLTLKKMKESEDAYGKDTPILIFTDLSVVDENLKIIAPSFFSYQSMRAEWSDKLSQLMIQNVAPGCTMMANRALLNIALPIPEQAVMHDWWLMLVANAFGKVAYVNEPTILYRQHGNNQVGAQNLKFNRLIKSFESGCKNLISTSRQADVFYQRYKDDLTNFIDHVELKKLKHFANFHRDGYFKNLKGFLKGYYRKNNLVRNVGLFLAIHWKVFIRKYDSEK